MKSWRETWPPTVLFGSVLLIIQGILAFALPRFQHQVEAQLASAPFLRNIIGAMIGSDVSGGLGPEMFAAIPWVHPVVLALVWAHAVVVGTRVPAGEVDRGTIDILLGLPVSRWELFITESVVWLGSTAILVTLALLGNSMGARLGGGILGVSPGRLIPVAANLFTLATAVGALSWLASALSDRRGRAFAVVLLMLLASFLLNYLAQFWEPAKWLVPFSILHYHQPLRTLQGGHWPLVDMATLLGATTVLWTSAGFVFARRDLSTT